MDYRGSRGGSGVKAPSKLRVIRSTRNFSDVLTFTEYNQHLVRSVCRQLKGISLDGNNLPSSRTSATPRANTGRILDSYPIHRFVATVIDLKFAPAARDARINCQYFTFQMKAKHRFKRARYIQPAEPVYQVQPPRPMCFGSL